MHDRHGESSGGTRAEANTIGLRMVKRMVMNDPVIGVEHHTQGAVHNTQHDTIAEMSSRFKFPERIGKPARKAANYGKLMPGRPSISAVRPKNLPDNAFVLHVLLELLSPRRHMDYRAEPLLIRGISLVVMRNAASGIGTPHHARHGVGGDQRRVMDARRMSHVEGLARSPHTPETRTRRRDCGTIL